jgi:hypothetical protein
MAMTQTERAPEADKIEELSKDKSTISADSRHVLIVAGRAAAQSPWLRNLNDYDRKERREYQVTRFG